MCLCGLSDNKCRHNILAREPMLSPALEPAARDCKAPREAMGFTEELLPEVGDEPDQRTLQ